VHGIEAQYSEQVDFIYLDIDDSRNDQFKRALGFRFQPHIFLLNGEGVIVDQWIGRITGDTLILAIEDALQ
jgi:hypothetical protein